MATINIDELAVDSAGIHVLDVTLIIRLPASHDWYTANNVVNLIALIKGVCISASVLYQKKAAINTN